MSDFNARIPLTSGTVVAPINIDKGRQVKTVAIGQTKDYVGRIILGKHALRFALLIIVFFTKYSL